jgi:hypothetical protein
MQSKLEDNEKRAYPKLWSCYINIDKDTTHKTINDMEIDNLIIKAALCNLYFPL